jgi:hypothetical protein
MNILLILISVLFVLYLLYKHYLHNPIKHFFTGKYLYKYEHIPGYGDIPSKYEWHKNDNDALNSKWVMWADFIYRKYPDDFRIKPKN